MKKIYLCALALSVGSLSFGQNISGKTFENAKLKKELDQYGPSKNYASSTINKAPGDTIWEEDFTGGLPTGWYVQDNTGNNAVWVIQAAGTLPDADFTTNQATIASNSGGNCMLLYSDLYESPMPAGGYYDMDSYFQTSGIQVSNFNGVSINFQQSFRRCCAITPAPVSVVSVSTDSTFATNFQEYDIIGGVGGNIASADPMDVSINISAIAGSYTGKIWVRFHIKSGSEAYYWMIDDITVVEAPTNDITAQAPYYGFTPVGTFGYQYTRIPVNHIQSADFTMIVDNIGTADQTGTQLNVDINDGSASVFNQSTTAMTLNSLTRDTLEMLGQWTPPATTGIPYTVTIDVSSDSTDLTPNNNGAVFPPFQVSQYTVALDDYSTTPGNGGAQADPNGATEHEAGNFMEAVISEAAPGVEFLAGSNTTIGASIDAVLYRSSGGDYIEIARSANYVVTAADTATPKTLLLIDGLTGQAPILQADSVYFFGIHSFDDSFQWATSGVGPAPNTNSATHSSVSFPNRASATTTYSLTGTPMIRLILDPNLIGVDEVEKDVKFNVFPNPSNGVFNINFSSNEENNVNLTVKNVVGQTVITETVNVSGKTNHQISLSDYSKGIYFLTVGNETVKLIVE